MSFQINDYVVGCHTRDRDLYRVLAVYPGDNGDAMLRLQGLSKAVTFNSPSRIFRPATPDEIQSRNRSADRPERRQLARSIMLADIQKNGFDHNVSDAEMTYRACAYYRMADAMLDAQE